MTSTDPRTALEAFRDALVDAMASEMHMLRAHREQWEVAAQGVMDKMKIRGAPLALKGMRADAVLFDRQPRAELPEVPRSTHGEAGDDPVVVQASERGEQGDGAGRAPGDAP